MYGRLSVAQGRLNIGKLNSFLLFIFEDQYQWFVWESVRTAAQGRLKMKKFDTFYFSFFEDMYH